MRKQRPGDPHDRTGNDSTNGDSQVHSCSAYEPRHGFRSWKSGGDRDILRTVTIVTTLTAPDKMQSAAIPADLNPIFAKRASTHVPPFNGWKYGQFQSNLTESRVVAADATIWLTAIRNAVQLPGLGAPSPLYDWDCFDAFAVEPVIHPEANSEIALADFPNLTGFRGTGMGSRIVTAAQGMSLPQDEFCLTGSRPASRSVADMVTSMNGSSRIYLTRMDVWQVQCSSCFGLDADFFMDVAPMPYSHSSCPRRHGQINLSTSRCDRINIAQNRVG